MDTLKNLNNELLTKLENLKENGAVAENRAKTALLYALYLWARDSYAKRTKNEEVKVELTALQPETEKEIINSLVGTAYYYINKNFAEVFKYIFLYENYDSIDDACESACEVLGKVNYLGTQGAQEEQNKESEYVPTSEEVADLELPEKNEADEKGKIVVRGENIVQFLSCYDAWDAWREFAVCCGGEDINSRLKAPLYWSVLLLGWIKFYDTNYDDAIKYFIADYKFYNHNAKQYTLINKIVFPSNFLENNLRLMQCGIREYKVEITYTTKGTEKKIWVDFAGIYRNGFDDYVRTNRCFKDVTDELVREYLKVCINDGDKANQLYTLMFEQISNVSVWLRLLDENMWTEAGKKRLLDALKAKFEKEGVSSDARILTDSCLRRVDRLANEEITLSMVERFKRRDGRYWKHADSSYKFHADAFYWSKVKEDEAYHSFVDKFYRLVIRLRVGDRDQRIEAVDKMNMLLAGEEVYYKSAARVLLEKDGLLVADFETMLKKAWETDDVALLLCCVVFAEQIRKQKPEDGNKLICDVARKELETEIAKRREEEGSDTDSFEHVLVSYVLLEVGSVFFAESDGAYADNRKLELLKRRMEEIKFRGKNARYQYYAKSVWKSSLANLFEQIMLIESFEDLNRYGMLLTKIMRIDFGFKKKIEEFNRTDVIYSNREMIYEAFLRDFSDPAGWDVLTKYYHEGNDNKKRDASNLIEVIKYPKDTNVNKYAYANVMRSLERTEYSQDAPNLLLNNTYLFGMLTDKEYFDEFLNQIRRSKKFRNAEYRTIRKYMEFFCELPLKSEREAEKIAENYVCDLLFELVTQTDKRTDFNVGEMIEENFKSGCRLENAFLAKKSVDGKDVYKNSSKLMNFVAKFSGLKKNEELQSFINGIDTESLYEKDRKAYEWWDESHDMNDEMSEEYKSFTAVTQIVFSEYPICDTEKICEAMEKYYENKEKRFGKYWDILEALTVIFPEKIELQKKVYLYVTSTVALGSEAKAKNSKTLEILERALGNIVHSVNSGSNTWDDVRTNKSWYAARYLRWISDDGDATDFFETLENEDTDKFARYLSALEALHNSGIADTWKQDVVFCGITNYWDIFVNKLLKETNYNENELIKYITAVENEIFWRRILQVLCYASVRFCYDKYDKCKKDTFTHTMVEDYFGEGGEGTAREHLQRIAPICELNRYVKMIYECIVLADLKTEEYIIYLKQLDFVLRHSSPERYLRNFTNLSIKKDTDIKVLCLAVLCLFKEPEYLDFVDALWRSNDKKKAEILLAYLKNGEFVEGLGNYVYEYCKNSDGFEEGRDALNIAYREKYKSEVEGNEAYVLAIQGFVKEYYEIIANAVIGNESKLTTLYCSGMYAPPVYKSHAKQLGELVKKYNDMPTTERGGLLGVDIKSLRLQENSYYAGVDLSFVTAHDLTEEEDLVELKKAFRYREKSAEKKCRIAEKIYHSFLYSDANAMKTISKDVYWINTFFLDWTFCKMDITEGFENKLGFLYELLGQTNYLLGVKKVERVERSNEKEDPFEFSQNRNKWKGNYKIAKGYFERITKKFYEVLGNSRLSYAEIPEFRAVFCDAKNDEKSNLTKCFAVVKSIYTNILKDTIKAEEQEIEEAKLLFVEKILLGKENSSDEKLKNFEIAAKYEEVRGRFERYITGNACPISVAIINEEEKTRSIFFEIYNDGNDLGDIRLDFYESEDGTGNYFTTGKHYSVTSGGFVYDECECSFDGNKQERIKTVTVNIEGKPYSVVPKKTAMVTDKTKIESECITMIHEKLLEKKHVVLVNKHRSNTLLDEIEKKLKEKSFADAFKKSFDLEGEAVVITVDRTSDTDIEEIKEAEEAEHVIVLWKNFVFADLTNEVIKYWNSTPMTGTLSFIFVVDDMPETKEIPNGLVMDYRTTIIGERGFRDCLDIGKNQVIVKYGENFIAREYTDSAVACMAYYTGHDVEKAINWKDMIRDYLSNNDKEYVYPSDVFIAVATNSEKNKNELMEINGSETTQLTKILEILKEKKILGDLNVFLGDVVGEKTEYHFETCDFVEIRDLIKESMDDFAKGNMQDYMGKWSDTDKYKEVIRKQKETYENKKKDNDELLRSPLLSEEKKAKIRDENTKLEQYISELAKKMENPETAFYEDILSVMPGVDEFTEENKADLLGITVDELAKVRDSINMESYGGWNYSSGLDLAIFLHKQIKDGGYDDYAPATLEYCKIVEGMLKLLHGKIYDNRFVTTDDTNKWWSTSNDLMIGAFQFHLNNDKRYDLSKIQKLIKRAVIEIEWNHSVSVRGDKKTIKNRLDGLSFSGCKSVDSNIINQKTCNGCVNRTDCQVYKEWTKHQEMIEVAHDVRNDSGHDKKTERNKVTSERAEKLVKVLVHKADDGLFGYQRIVQLYKYFIDREQRMRQLGVLTPGEYVFTYEGVNASNLNQWEGKIELDANTIEKAIVSVNSNTVPEGIGNPNVNAQYVVEIKDVKKDQNMQIYYSVKIKREVGTSNYTTVPGSNTTPVPATPPTHPQTTTPATPVQPAPSATSAPEQSAAPAAASAPVQNTTSQATATTQQTRNNSNVSMLTEAELNTYVNGTEVFFLRNKVDAATDKWSGELVVQDGKAIAHVRGSENKIPDDSGEVKRLYMATVQNVVPKANGCCAYMKVNRDVTDCIFTCTESRTDRNGRMFWKGTVTLDGMADSQAAKVFLANIPEGFRQPNVNPVNKTFNAKVMDALWSPQTRKFDGFKVNILSER